MKKYFTELKDLLNLICHIFEDKAIGLFQYLGIYVYMFFSQVLINWITNREVMGMVINS